MTAKEAAARSQEVAALKTKEAEALLNTIFVCIGNAADLGLREVDIYSIVRDCEYKYRSIIFQHLNKLGYKTTSGGQQRDEYYTVQW